MDVLLDVVKYPPDVLCHVCVGLIKQTVRLIQIAAVTELNDSIKNLGEYMDVSSDYLLFNVH